MEERKAHELYKLFQQVDRGAKQKQGLGFGGGAAGREYAGDDDDVIARNKRLRGNVHGAAPRDEDAGYDSDSATAVARRLKQLKREQGKEPSAVAQAAAAVAARHESRGGSDGKDRHRDRDRRRGDERGGHERGPREREWSRERERDREQRTGRRDEGGQRHRSPRSNSGDRDRRRRGERGDSRERGRDSRDSRSRRGEEGGQRHSDHRQQPRQQPPARAPDFERLIPGYAGMSAAQKLKARTQFLLERSSQQDKRKAEKEEGAGGQWTRFEFDQNAYLDEEGGRPADPTLHGEEAEGDEGAGGPAPAPRLNALTFKRSVAEAEMAGRDVSHEEAIFGRPPMLQAGEGGGDGKGAGGLGWRERAAPAAGATRVGVGAGAGPVQWAGGGGAGLAAEEEGAVVVEREGPAGAASKLSWRERAAQLRAQRGQNAGP